MCDSEDDLLTLFKQFNIRTGKLNPCNIKAWFDTDCADLLKWLCSSLTEDCYISPQEQFEYSQLGGVLTGDLLTKKTESVELEHPDLFEVERNLLEQEFACDLIQILEEDLQDRCHQLTINQKLSHNLAIEYSKLQSEEIQLQIEYEEEQQKCERLSQELDRINNQTYNQVVKYNSHLSNYDYAEFINNSDITEFEEKYHDIITSFESVTNDYTNLLETNNKSLIVSEMENRIFHSHVSLVALQMEIEAVNSTLKFYEKFDVDLYPFVDTNFIQVNIEEKKYKQVGLIEMVEALSSKYAEHCVNQPFLRCFDTILESYVSRLKCLNTFNENLMKILIHFILMYNLYLQEKLDISSSRKFLKNIINYIEKKLKKCHNRKQAMLKIIEEYKEFDSTPIENKFKLIKNFDIVFSNDAITLREAVEKVSGLRNNIRNLKNKHFNCIDHCRESLRVNTRLGIDTLQKFLVCGPTCQIVTIPHNLQMLLLQVDQSLANQHSSPKLLAQVVKETKDKIAKDKWLQYRNQLWMLFLTDPQKMTHLLCQLGENSTSE